MTSEDRPLPAAAIPTAALWLGPLGLLPFLAGAAALWLLPAAWSPTAVLALVGYGAVILSFLGGVHWGLAAAGPGERALQMSLSVLPSLLGWAAVVIAGLEAPRAQPWLAFALLVIAFGAVLAADLAAVQRRLAPRWYPRLRIPLTLVVMASLIAGAAA